MSGDLSLDILAEIQADGWRLWQLHQHSRGGWEARLYNTRVPARGVDSGFLSPDGVGETPRAAILAALGRVDDTGPLAKVPGRLLERLELVLSALSGQLEAGDGP